MEKIHRFSTFVLMTNLNIHRQVMSSKVRLIDNPPGLFSLDESPPTLNFLKSTQAPMVF